MVSSYCASVFRTLCNMCYIILNVGLFQFYSTAVFKLTLRLFLDYSNGFFIMCFCVPNPLQYVLYRIEHWTAPVLLYCCLQIDHNTVPVLQYCYLHYVLYQIDLTFVPGLQQWLLHNLFLCSKPSSSIRVYLGTTIS